MENEKLWISWLKCIWSEMHIFCIPEKFSDAMKWQLAVFEIIVSAAILENACLFVIWVQELHFVSNQKKNPLLCHQIVSSNLESPLTKSTVHCQTLCNLRDNTDNQRKNNIVTMVPALNMSSPPCSIIMMVVGRKKFMVWMQIAERIMSILL